MAIFTKKLLCLLTSLSLTLGIAGQGQTKISNSALPNSTVTYQEDSKGGITDLAIVNDEKLIEALKKSGKIPKDATPEQAQKLLKEYLKTKEGSYKKNPQQPTIKEAQALKAYGKTLVSSGKMKVDSTSKKKTVTASEVSKDNILVLAIEFPNFAHNKIQPGETSMYYKDYTLKHFNDMLFNPTSYAGPNGESLISMAQYYTQQSGGSYTVEGKVSGWYMAAHDAEYYGAHDANGGNDARPQLLVQEALVAASKDPKINLADYDKEDPYDLDGYGDLNEPDGIIDHLSIIHSGIGEEAGGGALGEDAIWSHSWKVVDSSGYPYAIPGTEFYGYNYTIMPEDGAAGVFCHEFGHDLGLPDEYDTQYTGAGEPVEYWSIMSSGSWAGKIPGTEPIGFSPYAKEYFQKRYGGNWLKGTTLDLKDITTKGTSLTLDQASIKGKNNGYVRVNLPTKVTSINTPTSGTYEYFSQKGDNLDNSMSATIDLTGKTSAKLTFNAWYNIEEGFDYASILVKADGDSKYVTVPGNITTTANPYGQNPGNGITGTSKGWKAAEFDLTKFAGKKLQLVFNYWTDGGLALPGFYADDIKVTADGSDILNDNVEGTPAFALDGFVKSDGKLYTSQYYLIEWRNQTAADLGLAHIARGKSLLSYDPGLLIWYVDNSYTDNWTGIHPGEGYLGIVDSDQTTVKYNDGFVASTRFQMHDAAFSLKKSQTSFIDYVSKTITDTNTFMHPVFDDKKNYLNSEIPDAGRNIPKLGLKVYVTSESKDRSSASILIKK